jgi:hypothetical protein
MPPRVRKVSERVPKPRYMSFVYAVANKILDPKAKIRVITPTRGVIS